MGVGGVGGVGPHPGGFSEPLSDIGPPWLRPHVPNFISGHDRFLESACFEHESSPAPYCPGPTSVDTSSSGGLLLVPNCNPTSLRFVDKICLPTEFPISYAPGPGANISLFRGGSAFGNE